LSKNRSEKLTLPMTNVIFYFCGKIGQTDWRESIVKIGRQNWLLDDPNLAWTDLPILQNAIAQGLHYSGLFFNSCDDRCAHAPHKHGAISCCEETSRNEVACAAQIQIERADILFAWLDDQTCFGSLVEIGIVKAADKEIWIAWPPKMGVIRDAELDSYPLIRDLWFAQSFADDCCMAESAKTAFYHFLAHNCIEARQTQELQKTVATSGQRNGS
jgi:hypothetical protein